MVLFLYKWTLSLLLPMSFVLSGTSATNNEAKHPFYISVTEVNQNLSEKSLEISCKFFADDFEQILEKDYKTTLDITDAKYKAVFDKYIPDYVGKHLSFSVDGKPVSINYVGYEKEKESAYAYFEIKNVSSIKNMSIANSLLHDFINQQINIMHVTVNGKRQSTKLDFPDTKAAFAF